MTVDGRLAAHSFVMPAEAGTQTMIRSTDVKIWLDPGLRRDDGEGERASYQFDVILGFMLSIHSAACTECAMDPGDKPKGAHPVTSPGGALQ